MFLFEILIWIRIAIDIPMEKSFLNFIYWILVKSAESYYGDSMKTEVPYTPYFWILFNKEWTVCNFSKDENSVSIIGQILLSR